MKLTETPSGYSGKPLIVKLGLKPGFTVFILNQPENYFEILGELPEGISVKKKSSAEIDFIHFFTKDQKEYTAKLLSLKKNLAKNGMLWISWPKKTSSITTDLNENIIRDIALENGLVDVKVCAVDDNWSGLKLVYRLKDR